MQYRKFGRLDWECSALGFGAMRLPQTGQDFSSPINEPEAVKMIRYAIDNGVNYIDTAFPYGMGKSERVVGKALQDGYRQKVRLATKLTPFLLKSADEFEQFLNGQLERLQTDKIDFYLLHGLDAKSWKQMKEWKAIQFMEQKAEEDKIGHLGFSFHDTFEVFKEIVDSYDNWAFCQVQYNYLDEHNQAGRKGVEYAAAKGLAVIIMEPLRGGRLAQAPPPTVAQELAAAAVQRSCAEWALEWLWDQEAVSLVLSGMSNMEQTVQNIDLANRSGIGSLSAAEKEVYNRVIRAYQNLYPIPCTTCKYCQPCPSSVNIPRIFEIYNDRMATDDPRLAIWYATDLGMPPEQRADNCTECAECIKVCPQKIDIPVELKKIHDDLMRNNPFGPPPPKAASHEE
jgi:uncharacterized protein